MFNNLTRRTLVKGLAATGLAGALGGRAALAADEPLGIALVIPSPVGDVGWGHAVCVVAGVVGRRCRAKRANVNAHTVN